MAIPWGPAGESVHGEHTHYPGVGKRMPTAPTMRERITSRLWLHVLPQGPPIWRLRRWRRFARDFAMDLLGPIRRVCGALARFAERTKTPDGRSCPPSDVDDWSCLIGEFACGATGVWEGTTLAKGYGRGGFGHEWAEINGSEGSAVYQLHQPNTILLGKTGSDLAPVDVPKEVLKPAGSPRDLAVGEPATVFRYDLMWEFISAIIERRQAVPSFLDGLNAQLVADAVIRSCESREWVEILNA
jgi:predicted dehydrogenase